VVSDKAVLPYNPTQEEMDAILGDIFYEVQQLFMASELVTNHPSLMNALLESALLHMRVLLGFFEMPRRTADHGQDPPIEKDDVLSIDFGFPVTQIAVDSTYRERLNKDLAHLTYSRTSRLPECRDWPHRQVVFPVLQRAIEFIEFLGPERRGQAKGATPVEWDRLLDALKTYGRLHHQ